MSASQVTIEFTVENFTVGSAGDGADGHVHYQLNSNDPVMHYSNDPFSLSDLSWAVMNLVFGWWITRMLL